MRRLFRELPDIEQLSNEVGITAEETAAATSEFAFVCKSITRLGRGYVIGGGRFSRPGSRADATSPRDEESGDRWWVLPQELADTLSDRTGLPQGVADALIDGISHQLYEADRESLKVAAASVDLERAVHNQLLDSVGVLKPWGWDITDIRSEVRLNPESRADLVGRLTNGDYIVVELKRWAAVKETADQILRYMDALSEAADNDRVGVRGLVLADGDDPTFYARIKEAREDVKYLPVRRLNLPACRPQTHDIHNAGIPAPATLVVAADGRTAVGATPGLEWFTSDLPEGLHEAGRREGRGEHTPRLPVS